MRRASPRLTDAAASLGGIALVVAGLLLLRVASSTPLAWGWLRDTLSAVFPNPANIVRGTVLIVLGGMLYGWSVRNGSPFPNGRNTLDVRTLAWPGSRVAFPLALALGLYAATVILVIRGSTGYLAGALFLAALVLWSVTVARSFPTTKPETSLTPRSGGFAGFDLFSRWELLGLTIAAAAAFILYVHDAQNWFFSWVGDEYAFFDRARSIAEGAPTNIFRQDGVYGTHPVMDSVFQAGVMRVLGINAFGWRASGALATAVTAFPIYLIGRVLYSRLVGALAVGIYLPAHILIAYAHIGYNEPDALFPLVATLALFLVGRIRRAPFYLFLAGIFAGIGWYTISTSRVAIGLILLGVVLYAPRTGLRQWLRATAYDAALILGGFTLVLLPFLLVNGSFTIQAMSNQSRIGLPGVPSVSTMLSQNGPRSLFGYIYLPQVDNHYVAGAFFESVSAFLLLLGMAALLAWKTVHSAFLLIWYWLLVAVNGPLYYELHLNTTRMYIVATAAAVIAAVGAGSLVDRVRTLGLGPTQRVPGRLPAVSWSRALPVASAAFIVAVVVASNLYTFYHVTPSQMVSNPQPLAMEVIQAHPDATVVEAGVLADATFFTAEEAYGVEGRVIPAASELAGSLPAALREARQRGRPIIVVADSNFPDPGLKGQRVILWDPAHIQHIVETVLPR